MWYSDLFVISLRVVKHRIYTLELNQNLLASRWSFSVFMTLFTTDKTAKKPISYLSTKMWVVSSKTAIKTFSRMCGILDLQQKMVLVDKLNTKSKIQLMHLHWFLETILTFLFWKNVLPCSNLSCMNVCLKNYFFG